VRSWKGCWTEWHCAIAKARPGVLFCFPGRSRRIEEEMIVRMWHGRVPASKTEAYRKFTNGRAIPDYRAVPGNISVHVLERRDGDVTHFITLTFWDSLESIRGFAGPDVEVARYYPEDQDYLLEFELRVTHYEVVGKAP